VRARMSSAGKRSKREHAFWPREGSAQAWLGEIFSIYLPPLLDQCLFGLVFVQYRFDSIPRSFCNQARTETIEDCHNEDDANQDEDDGEEALFSVHNLLTDATWRY
jgi:hypothetical protein